MLVEHLIRDWIEVVTFSILMELELDEITRGQFLAGDWICPMLSYPGHNLPDKTCIRISPDEWQYITVHW